MVHVHNVKSEKNQVSIRFTVKTVALEPIDHIYWLIYVIPVQMVPIGLLNHLFNAIPGIL